MRPVLIDTGVFSFVAKADSRAALYQPHLYGIRQHISFQTVAELRRWGIERNLGDQRMRALERAIDKTVVIPPNHHICMQWAQISAAAKAMGRPIQCGDAWISATAIHLKMVLLTHNRSDFENVAGLELISYQ